MCLAWREYIAGVSWRNGGLYTTHMEEMEHCSIHNQKKPCPTCRAQRFASTNKKECVVAAIAAIGRNRELGKGNELLWHIPDDLKRFKELSIGHPIILGRKTFESIVAMIGKPLLGRTNIVVTRDTKWKHEGVVTAISIEDALEKARGAPGGEKVIIGGGAEIYKLALPYTDILHLTLIGDSKDADSFFPEYEKEFMKMIHNESREWNGLVYQWMTLSR